MTYLGMPLTLKAPKRQDFIPLLHKLEQRLEGWRARFISKGGRLQLVKYVLSSIPTYYMSCFRFPKWLIERIDKIRRQFLWGRPQQGKAIHLINWTVACLPLKCGGLGIPNLHLQNISLLLRWWWRLFSPDHKLWRTYASLLYAMPSTQPAPLVLSNRGSFFWNSLSSLRPLFHCCSTFQIGSGKTISYWFDGWDGLPLVLDRDGPITRKDISLFQARSCAHTLLHQPFTLRQHKATQKMTAYTPSNQDDNLLWSISSSGNFTVKSVYSILSIGGKTLSPVAPLWRARVPPSLRVFFFLLLNNRLLTHDVMQRRNLPHTHGCVMCSTSSSETALHLFFSCPLASQVWSGISSALGYDALRTSDSVLNTYSASTPAVRHTHSKWRTFFITTTWFLWRERNERTFRLRQPLLQLFLPRLC